MNTLSEWLEQFSRNRIVETPAEPKGQRATWQLALAFFLGITEKTRGGYTLGRRLTSPQAITVILSEATRPLFPKEIMSEMIKREWITSETRRKKQLYATLSRMSADKRVERLSGGSYILSPRVRDACTRR